MADLQRTVGTVIRRERQERRLTHRELARRAIISVVYLGEIERGKKYPSPLVLERLAAGLDLAVSDLLDRIAAEMRGLEQPPVRAIGFGQQATQGAPRVTVTRIVSLFEPAAPVSVSSGPGRPLMWLPVVSDVA